MSSIPCPVCATPLTIAPARSRKARNPKLFLMLVRPQDGRHFRGFINDKEFVNRALEAAKMPVETVHERQRVRVRGG